VNEKERYRAPRETKVSVREHFGLADHEPLPDLSMFPLKKLAELARYVTPVGSYVDAYPVHLLTRASLAAMKAQTPSSDFDVRPVSSEPRPRHRHGAGAAGEFVVRRRTRSARRDATS
jgi:uncharacterized protein